MLRTFELIDRCITEYEEKASTDIFARICGITLLKGKNLAHGSLSLVLDALGQESGALLRPWIESIELLTYLRKFPEEAARAAENDLPSAGIRAMKIDGIFKDVREYLNDNASHSSYSSHSLSHLLTPDFKFRKLQEFVPQVLDENLANFAAQQQLLLQEGFLSLQPLALTPLPILELEAQHLRREMLLVFELGGV